MNSSPMLPNNKSVYRLAASVTAWVLLAVSAQALNGMPLADCAVDRAEILTREGPQTVQVEIADTPEARARGLMFRQDLPQGHGMLFIYDSPQPVSFWMRNTYVSLDMLFLDGRGIIRHIHRNARPLDETPIPGAAVGDPDPRRLMVLEVVAGEADRLRLAQGQPLAHPALELTQAAWRCR